MAEPRKSQKYVELKRVCSQISDLKGNLYEKQAISGHKNVEQTARYDRKIAVVPVVDGQVERKNIMK